MARAKIKWCPCCPCLFKCGSFLIVHFKQKRVHQKVKCWLVYVPVNSYGHVAVHLTTLFFFGTYVTFACITSGISDIGVGSFSILEGQKLARPTSMGYCKMHTHTHTHTHIHTHTHTRTHTRIHLYIYILI